jgi:hypothetical protein
MNRFAEAGPTFVGSRAGRSLAPIPNLADRGRLRLIAFCQRWGKPDEVQKPRSGKG